MAVPNAVLRHGRQLASPEEQAVWVAIYSKQFGGSSDDDLATTEKCSATTLEECEAEIAHSDR
jgi:hypothetical protein